MPGKQKADPIPASTYAGFAASPPGEPKDDLDLRLNGEGRTYRRAELRRRTKRRRAPLVAATVAAALVVGGAVGFALLYQPKAELPGPPPPPPPLEPAASQVADVSTPSADSASSLDAAPDAAPAQASEDADAPAAAPAPAVAQPPRPAEAARPERPAPAAVAPKPAVRLAAVPKAPQPAKGRSAAQAAADRAATDRVSALAALDQEVNKAYAEALNAGAAPGPLGEAQENWIIRRDRVRREDPDMAGDLARARIAELRAIAAKNAQGGSSPAAAPEAHARQAQPDTP